MGCRNIPAVTRNTVRTKSGTGATTQGNYKGGKNTMTGSVKLNMIHEIKNLQNKTGNS